MSPTLTRITALITAINQLRPADEQLQAPEGFTSESDLSEFYLVHDAKGNLTAIGYSEADLLANLEKLFVEVVMYAGLRRTIRPTPEELAADKLEAALAEQAHLRAEVRELRHTGRDFTESFAAKLARLQSLNAEVADLYAAGADAGQAWLGKLEAKGVLE